MRIYLLLFYCFVALSISAQDFQQEMEHRLSEQGIHIFSPIEKSKFTIKPDLNKFLNTSFILNHHDKLDVRVEIFSYPQDSMSLLNPHVKNGMRLGHLVNNQGESNIAMHRLGSEDLTLFGADWATQTLFQPKEEFSTKANCQLISLYKEEVGLIFLYLLFDDIEKYKDEWRYLIGFSQGDLGVE